MCTITHRMFSVSIWPWKLCVIYACIILCDSECIGSTEKTIKTAKLLVASIALDAIQWPMNNEQI